MLSFGPCPFMNSPSFLQIQQDFLEEMMKGDGDIRLGYKLQTHFNNN